MKEWVLVISMWGHTGEEWQYIGNQIVLDQPMIREQCEYLVKENAWKEFYDNQYYKLVKQCYPIDCQGKDKCN